MNGAESFRCRANRDLFGRRDLFGWKEYFVTNAGSCAQVWIKLKASLRRDAFCISEISFLYLSIFLWVCTCICFQKGRGRRWRDDFQTIRNPLFFKLSRKTCSCYIRGNELKYLLEIIRADPVSDPFFYRAYNKFESKSEPAAEQKGGRERCRIGEGRYSASHSAGRMFSVEA